MIAPVLYPPIHPKAEQVHYDVLGAEHCAFMDGISDMQASMAEMCPSQLRHALDTHQDYSDEGCQYRIALENQYATFIHTCAQYDPNEELPF